MKFEKLSNKNNSKKVFLYGFITCAILLIMFNLFMSYAKYKVVDSVKLASGTVSYTNADLNVIAIYIKEGEKEELVSDIPKGYYEIDNETSYCTVPNEDTHIKDKISYDGEEVNIKISKKGTKCYVYFISSASKTLANMGIKDNVKEGKTEFTGIATAEDSGLYSGEDDYGTTYYYRGIVDNNWVKMGSEYWRIIRINGNGTIRLLYNGKTTKTTGEETLAKTGVAFNSTNNNDNKYVGLMYGGENGQASTSYENAHKNETKSNILNVIEDWYNTNNNLKSFAQYLDGGTGFCEDRTKVEGTITDTNGTFTNFGFGDSKTIYGAYHRFLDDNNTTHWGRTQNPTFKCGVNPASNDTVKNEYVERDLYTTTIEKGIGNGALQYPVGLITADEVVYAGGFAGGVNTTYWLYTGEKYWTMSPRYLWIIGYAGVFSVHDNGLFNTDNVSNTTPGVRPVINLKSNITFEPNGKGTIESPYIVQ